MGSPLGLFRLVDEKNNPVNKSHRVYDGGSKGIGQKVKSLFDNTTVFSPFPDGAIDNATGSSLKIKRFVDVHNDDIYNTSISSIIKYTEKHPGMKLDFMDFAFLRNLGVYPNNRLIVARRFGSAVGNDLTKMTVPPLKTIVSWVPDTQDNFLSLNYSEVWTEAEASYTTVLNDLGKSLTIPGSDLSKANIGDFLAAGANLIPFPALSEPIQRLVMKEFGLITDDAYNLPLGNPNLIRMAKRRQTVTPDEPGSGLSCEVEIKMVVEYEQKFISGIDPTLAYLDILQNALYFGTSDAAFQMGAAFGAGAKGILNDLISGNYQKIMGVLKKIVTTIFKKLTEIIGALVDFIIAPPEDEEDKQDKQEDKAAGEDPAVDKARTKLSGQLLATFAAKNVGAVIGKYKHRLLGITNALTGAPSTPWHITIGNPKKPVFSSGDMLLTNVEMEMGQVLAFNDLPSTMKFTLSFKNARPLGAQEIFNRFNTGKGRTVLSVSLQSQIPTNPDGTPEESGKQKNQKVTKSFDASPTGNENSDMADYKYGTTVGKGVSWFTWDNEFQDGNVAADTEPVNMAEAQRTEDGKVQSVAATNQSQLAPSAGQGQPQISPQPSGGGASKKQTKKPVPQKGKAKSNGTANSPGSTALTESQIKVSSNDQLKARRDNLIDENGGLSLQKRALDQAPKNETAEQKAARLSKKATVEKKILSNSKESDMIKKEQQSRTQGSGPRIQQPPVNTALAANTTQVIPQPVLNLRGR